MRISMGGRVALVVLASFYESTAAHPGGLNAEGRRNNRKTGNYPCHKSSRQRLLRSVSIQAATFSVRSTGTQSSRTARSGAAPQHERPAKPRSGVATLNLPHTLREGSLLRSSISIYRQCKNWCPRSSKRGRSTASE